MSIEMSRRGFLRRIGISLIGTAVLGIALPESRGLDREANRNELREFLDSPIPDQEPLRLTTSNFLAHFRRDKPSEIGWAHNADSRKKMNAFVLDDKRDVAELDIRFNTRKDKLYVAHKRGGKSDIDPGQAYSLVTSSELPKALKYDFKEPEAMRKMMGSIDTKRPCVINADLYGNDRFGITPQQFVDMSDRLPNALISIGRKLESGSIKDFVEQFTKLAMDNPDRDFIMPAHIIDFLSDFDELKRALEVPNISLMIYRTSNYTLTQGHLNWLKENFDDATRSRTFFDL